MLLRNRVYWIALLACFIWPVIAHAESSNHFEKLPWPPMAEQRREIGEEIKTVLKRSAVPEAKELLQYLPPSTGENYDKLDPKSRVYFGEWKLADDGITLWTARIRNELIRHQYEIRFTIRGAKFVGSDLGVITAHGIPKTK